MGLSCSEPGMDEGQAMTEETGQVRGRCPPAPRTIPEPMQWGPESRALPDLCEGLGWGWGWALQFYLFGAVDPGRAL